MCGVLTCSALIAPKAEQMILKNGAVVYNSSPLPDSALQLGAGGRAIAPGPCPLCYPFSTIYIHPSILCQCSSLTLSLFQCFPTVLRPQLASFVDFIYFSQIFTTTVHHVDMLAQMGAWKLIKQLKVHAGNDEALAKGGCVIKRISDAFTWLMIQCDGN